MASLSNLKPFLPLIVTFLSPRAISYYRALKTAIRTRPPTRPLPPKTARGLNVLFCSVCLFLFWTLPIGSTTADQNIFSTTNARLHIPTDVLFSRLSMLRPNGQLTPFDESLKSKISTPISRQLYLRFGPHTVVDCSFCHPDDDSSYVLYHLPTNVLLPHLIHLLVVGLSTSESLAGIEARRWRNKSTIGALALLMLDIYVTVAFKPTVDGNMPSPDGLFWRVGLIRPLLLCLFDIVVAFSMYASATNSFLLFVSTEFDPIVAQRQREQMLSQANVSLQMAQTKLRAFTVARNASVREPRLKAADDEYWRAIVAMEGPSNAEGIWEDEEVQAAMASSFGNGNFDIGRLNREAEAFVNNITQGLDAASAAS